MKLYEKVGASSVTLLQDRPLTTRSLLVKSDTQPTLTS